MDHPARTRTDSARSSSFHHLLPSITVDGSKENPEEGRLPFRHSISHRTSLSANPMPIPNAKDDFAPPALPPPRFIEDTDIALQFRKGSWHEDQKSLPSINPGSSLFGGFVGPRRTEEPRKAESITESLPDVGMRRDGVRHPDEGYASLPGSSLGGSFTVKAKNSVDKAYDQSLVDKLNPVRSDTSRRGSLPRVHPFTPQPHADSGIELSPRSKMRSASTDAGARQLQPLSVPDHSSMTTPFSGDEFGARREFAPDSAISMGSKSHHFPSQSFLGPRQPSRHNSSLSSVPESESARWDREHSSSRSGSGSMLGSYDESVIGSMSRSHRGSHDYVIYEEPESDVLSEESQMKHLRLGDGDRTSPRLQRYSPGSKAGQKRRASSPPREGDERMLSSSSANSNDLFHRRSSGHLSAQRISPTGQYPPPLSTASSITMAGSTLSSTGASLTANSQNSISSYDRVSPGTLSPTSEFESRHGSGHGSPHVRSLPLNLSPRDSLSRPHQRTISESKPGMNVRKLSNGEQPVPVKHHTVPKLQGVHICDCCPKKPKRFDTAEGLRFKNKNEAERHQNSLHLRRHSWSCAALLSYEAAFHQSPFKNSPGGSDVCGYCGQEFSLPANWMVRIEHLNNVHKFGECNQAKKFFRADHFRQHLKHSHAGTSGKWTNMLENACMKDEPAPERTGSGVSSSMEGDGGLRSHVIDEELEEM
ncbi:MAG: hypothetical protein M1816_007931 [Peltula sp. TS41687]|nr:MAG: hypothetical protein M1816_007931 [Peltula sp. TS41687]